MRRAIAEKRAIPKPVPEQPATGFWQYLYRDKIHPSFLLHRTVTLRSSSESPNGQNFPKRGALAKEYRRIFIPAEGYDFLECVRWLTIDCCILALMKISDHILAQRSALRPLLEEEAAKTFAQAKADLEAAT